jgi:A/G-specific adenine glycosylase
MSEALIKNFATKLIAWHGKDGRQGLPWQSIRDPYAVWVSEIMLHETLSDGEEVGCCALR